MPEHVRHGEEVVNVETHHEKSDVNVRALLWFVVLIIVFAAISHVLIWLMFRYYRERDRAQAQAAPPLTAIARPSGEQVPPEPRLQPFPNVYPGGQVQAPYASTPVMDLRQMRAAEDQALKTPGWVDQQKGIVRIPIDIAKQLVIQQGLPVTGTSGTEGATAPATTTTGTTGSSQ